MISVSIYGSVARQQTDEFSDRDVLILAPSKEDALGEISRWKSLGWNASFFTDMHFARLVEFKSLFVQHIKLEGHVIRDDGGRLRKFLNQFVPALSYQEDLKDALLPLNWIDPSEPDYWVKLCVGDILFVVARNAGILHAAGTGRYVYEYGAVIEHLASTFELSFAERIALLNLRSIKAAYRARSTGVDLGTALEDAVAALSIVKASVDQLTLDISRDFIPNNYQALRRTELTLLKLNDPRELDRLSTRDFLFELWQLICNPSDYPKLRVSSLFSRKMLVSQSQRVTIAP